MEDQSENFDQLRRLLALKKHEVPPPGYFNKLPGEVTSRIRMERHAQHNAYAKLSAEAPWLARFWQALVARPVFAGGFGAAVCSVILAGVFLAEKPPEKPQMATESPTAPTVNPFMTASAVEPAGVTLERPSIVSATNLNNSAPQNLFEMVQPFQAAPVAVRPNE